jgi:phosphohistidine phosphatase
LRPDRVLCSPATRARETLEIVVAGLPGLDVRYQDDLYLASRPTLVASLAGVDPEVQTLLLVGHNPGLAELAAWLDPDVRPPLTLAPAALAVFELRVDDWSDLASGAAELRAHL